MKPVFADTSFYVALLNPEDVAHAKALQVGHSIRRLVLLSDFVVLELGNALSARAPAHCSHDLSTTFACSRTCGSSPRHASCLIGAWSSSHAVQTKSGR